MLLGLLPLALAACTGPDQAYAYPSATTAPVGVDLGGSASRMADRPALDRRPMPVGEEHEPTQRGMQMAHEGHSGAHATGMVNSVNPSARKVNISHGPITELGWPAMTMDFPVATSVDLKTIKPGSHVNFTLGKGQHGMPLVQSIEPAGQGG